MTRPELVRVIRCFMTEALALPYMHRFSEEARLNEDLCLDSVMMLQLLVSLELQHGVVIPEEAILEKQLGTVGSFVDFLLRNRVATITPAAGLTAGAAS
jgi:acyl carrier protein